MNTKKVNWGHFLWSLPDAMEKAEKKLPSDTYIVPNAEGQTQKLGESEQTE
jgi:hypothetical protein